MYLLFIWIFKENLSWLDINKKNLKTEDDQTLNGKEADRVATIKVMIRH